MRATERGSLRYGRDEPQGHRARGAETISGTPAALRTLTQSIIGAAIEVHRHLGPGFLESTYERALAVELEVQNLRFQRQVPMSVSYKGSVVGDHRVDFLIEDQVIVELKAVESISPFHLAQTLAYLKAGAFQVGLLINFDVPTLVSGVRRLVWSG